MPMLSKSRVNHRKNISNISGSGIGSSLSTPHSTTSSPVNSASVAKPNLLRGPLSKRKKVTEPNNPIVEQVESEELMRTPSKPIRSNGNVDIEEVVSDSEDEISADGSSQPPALISQMQQKRKNNGEFATTAVSASFVSHRGNGGASKDRFASDSDSESPSGSSLSSSLIQRRRLASLSSSRSETMSQSSSSILSRSEPLNRDHPDWIKFTAEFQKSPNDVHNWLSKELRNAGTGASSLLGRLVVCAVSEQGDDSLANDLFEKYSSAIIKAVLRVTIMDVNFNNKDEANATNEMIVDLVNMMFTELRHFTSAVLYNIVETCLEYIKDDKDKDKEDFLRPRWVEILGKIVSVLIGRGDIKHETDIIDGKAYREYVITEICRLKWSKDNTASLISLVREIPGIEESDLKIILRQVHSCIKNFNASVIPPIVHQLIVLAADRCPVELLAICEEYFGTVDFTDTSSLVVRQKRNSLGTVVFHFLEGARNSNSLLKAVLKYVKASFFDFGKVMNPFILSIVLGLTTYDHAKTAIIEPLKNSIMRSFHSMYLSRMSNWYHRTAEDSTDKVTPCFAAILESTTSKSELEFMLDGLRELGIGLLTADSYQNKYPNTMSECQNLGTYLITSLVRKYEAQLGVMMHHLLKVSSKSLTHTQCLSQCLQLKARQTIHPSVIGKSCEIIRSLPMMDSNSAALMVKAMSTALQLSYTLLDQLLINLRKTIWKSVEARRTAAKIMIILLSNSRVVGDVPFSQFSESQRAFHSENRSSSSDNGQLPDNQPLCMELLTLTKRCLTQQCEIREELYLGFHTVIRRNPELCELICSQVYNHGDQYLKEGEGDAPEFSLERVVELPSINTTSIYSQPCTIKEELGFLVQCLSFLVMESYKAFHAVDDGPPTAVKNLETLIKRWTDAVLTVTVGTAPAIAAQIVTDAGGARPLEAAQYVETVFTIQIMQITEALMEFLIVENKKGSDRKVKKLHEVFKLLEPTLKKEKKPTNKKGKGDKTKGGKSGKDNTNNDDTCSVADTASESSEAAVRFKKPEAPKRLVYKHIMNLESILSALTLLNKSDSDKGALTLVWKAGTEYEQFLLEIVKQKLDSFKRNEPLHERSRYPEKVAETFADIAGVIWNGLLVHNELNEEEVADVTVDSALLELRLEVVNEIAAHLCASHLTVCSHLIKGFGDECEDVSFEHAFPKFFSSWKAVQAWIPAGDENDKTSLLFDILQSFSKPLLPDPNSQQRSHSSEVLNWIWGYMNSEKTFSAEFSLADSVTSCWLSYYAKTKGFLEQPGGSQHDILSLAKSVRSCLGDVEELQDSSVDMPRNEMWLINQDTASTVLCAIMNFIESLLLEITALLGKLRGHQTDNDTVNRKAAVMRDACFNMINQILMVSSELVSSAFPGGLAPTTMLQIIPQIFTVLAGFSEYFVELSKNKQDFSIKGFAVPVKRIGNEFKCLVEAMINHIERVQREYAEEITNTKQTNKKSKAPKVPNAVKNQLIKDKKLIPNLVYSIEKYDQQIIALSNRIKDKHGSRLLVGMKLSTSRDYKINAGLLAEALENRVRTVQDLSTIPEDETTNQVATGAPPPSRPRKARKRKNTDEADATNET